MPLAIIDRCGAADRCRVRTIAHRKFEHAGSYYNLTKIPLIRAIILMKHIAYSQGGRIYLEPELNTEILKPGPLAKESLLLGYEVQPPAPAVETPAPLPESGNTPGKQEILFGNLIVTHVVLGRKPVEMDQ